MRLVIRIGNDAPTLKRGAANRPLVGCVRLKGRRNAVDRAGALLPHQDVWVAAAIGLRAAEGDENGEAEAM